MTRRGSTTRGSVSVARVLHILIVLTAVAALLMGYASVFVNPEEFWLPGFMGLYIMPIALLNLAFLFIEMIRHSRFWYVLFIAMSPMLFVLEFYVQFGEKEDVRGGGSDFSLMTYNVGRFHSAQNGQKRRDVNANIIKFVGEHSPDVLCLQEYEIDDTTVIRERFRQYPYLRMKMFRLQNGRMFGNVTLSRFKIVESGEITFKGSTNLSLWSDILVGGDTVRVYNNHLESNNISLVSLLKKFAMRNAGLTSDVAEVHGKMKTSFIRRAGQVNDIAKHKNECGHPSVTCGDFNDTPVSYTFRAFFLGNKDTFYEAGGGFGATYSVLWPLLRIDYVFVPESFCVLKHETLKVPWSDHYPVLTEFCIRKLLYND